MPDNMPAGWYPAPHANNEQRFWDGQRWLDAPPSGQPAQAGPPFGSGGNMGQPVLQATRPTKPPRGLAITALVLGIAAFLTGFVPVLGALLAVAAVAVAITALVKRQPKAMAIVGLVLGGIALLTGLAIAGNRADDSNSVSRSVSEVAPTETDVASAEPSVRPTAADEPAGSSAVDETPSDPPREAGTIENPSAQPYVAKGLLGGEKYSLTARIVDANANALVKQYNMFNPEAPAGFKYVVAELTMTGIDPDGVEPSLASFDLSLATSEGNRYDDEYIIYADGMPSMSDGPKLYPGSTFTGYTAYIVPEGAQSFLLYDNGNYVSF